MLEQIPQQYGQFKTVKTTLVEKAGDVYTGAKGLLTNAVNHVADRASGLVTNLTERVTGKVEQVHSLSTNLMTVAGEGIGHAKEVAGNMMQGIGEQALRLQSALSESSSLVHTETSLAMADTLMSNISQSDFIAVIGILSSIGAGGFVNALVHKEEFEKKANKSHPFWQYLYTNTTKIPHLLTAITLGAYLQLNNPGEISIVASTVLGYSTSDLIHSLGNLKIEGNSKSQEEAYVKSGIIGGSTPILTVCGILAMNEFIQGYDPLLYVGLPIGYGVAKLIEVAYLRTLDDPEQSFYIEMTDLARHSATTLTNAFIAYNYFTS
jgi:hypothetical protein